MLSKEQKEKLDKMETKYYYSMIRTTKKPYHIINAWSRRYKAAMGQVLQKQGKR